MLKLHEYSPSQARNAYAGMLLIPGYSALRFLDMLKACKKQWNTSTPKYSSFFDAGKLLLSLEQEGLNWQSISELRTRLIVTWRLLHLHRSIDLQRTLRVISWVGEGEEKQYFILVQRKGWKHPRWEEILSLPERKEISPLHILVQYVRLTSSMTKECTPCYCN